MSTDLQDLIAAEVARQLQDAAAGGMGSSLTGEDGSGGGLGGSGEDGSGGGFSGGEDGSGGGFSGGEDGGGGSGDSGGDSMTPTYQTIDALGNVSALFSGGILFNEGTTNQYDKKNGAGWQDTGGVIREQVTGSLGAGSHTLFLSSDSDANDQANIFLFSKVVGAAGTAMIQVQCFTGSKTANNILLTDTAKSDFMQLTGGPLFCKTGVVTLTWNGTGQATPAVNVKVNTAAVGHVDAVATPQGLDNALLAPVVFAIPDGAGGVNFQAETKGGASPPNGTFVTYAYVMWGS